MKKTELEIISEVKSKWITFKITGKTPKTVIIRVMTPDHEIFLGRIYFLTRWRCYIYEPQPNTIYEKVCMRDIANLLELLTQNQRIK